MKYIFFFFYILLFFNCSSKESTVIIDETPNLEENYFPAKNATFWETKSISDLNWNENQLQPLLNFLDEKNTKGFIILYNGRIVIEEYFNNHTAASTWYWASAGKTLTTAISGIAQDQGFINLNNKISDYLGTGWTSITLEKENLITCKNLLSMTSGLDDTLGEDVSPINLKYITDAGSR